MEARKRDDGRESEEGIVGRRGWEEVRRRTVTGTRYTKQATGIIRHWWLARARG